LRSTRIAIQDHNWETMLFIPLPFCVGFALIIVLIRMTRRDEGTLRAHPLFPLLIALYALQSVLIGLRWGYDIRAVLPAQAILATAIAGLAWVSFARLSAAPGPIWPHLLPAGFVAGLLVFWPEPVGPVIIGVFCGYGARLLWLARLGPDGLTASPLGGVPESCRALKLTAFALIASALTDILINIDLETGGGALSGTIIAGANLVALLLLGIAAASVEPGEAEEEPASTIPVATASEADADVAACIDRLMEEERLFLDPDLNLTRIARRLHLPTRSISQAINRQQGISVSHYVNNRRIAEACRLLRETQEPVTRVLFDAGFLTKSNFNREFQRVTGTSPTAWRKQNS
jgi:AraC-like DNA-binding protein